MGNDVSGRPRRLRSPARARSRRQGADIRYEQEILECEFVDGRAKLLAQTAAGERLHYEGHFLLDASGFGRVLPRLLKLDRPSQFPVRRSINTHVADRISHPDYDRNKILVGVHPEHHDVWYWLIPFCQGRSSIGVVARDSFFEGLPADPLERIQSLIGRSRNSRRCSATPSTTRRFAEISGYAADVTQPVGAGLRAARQRR